jgi:hypothetical protein
MNGLGRDWRPVVLAIVGGGGGLFALASAAGMLVLGVVLTLRSGTAAPTDKALQVLVLASAIALIGGLLLPACYYSTQYLRGREIPTSSLRRLQVWQVAFLLPLWIGTSFAAQLLAEKAILRWLAPAFYLLAIGIPFYFLACLATGGLGSGSCQRSWGALAMGMIVGPGLAIVAEFALALIGLIAASIYIGFHPSQLAPLQELAHQLGRTGDLELAFRTMSPWLGQPVALLLALAVFSGLTPMIEETSKSLIPWLIFDHLNTPADGFVAGALSGAGFGLVESLLASATPGANWAATLLMRGGSTMMHVMAAGLTGWGIAVFRSNRRPGYLFAAYALAVLLHGLWNASAVIIVFGGLRTALTARASDPAGTVLIVLGGSILAALGIAIPVALGVINRRLASTRESANPPSGNGEWSAAAMER